MATRSGENSLGRTRCRITLIVLSGLSILLPTAAPVRADDAELHRITYTVTSDHAIDVDVYYRDADPPSWGDYSHDPYQFSPKDDVTLGPGMPWVREVVLADPDRWAIVAVGRLSAQAEGVIRCELAIDGTIRDTSEGPAGALCSLRHW